MVVNPVSLTVNVAAELARQSLFSSSPSSMPNRRTPGAEDAEHESQPLAGESLFTALSASSERKRRDATGQKTVDSVALRIAQNIARI